MKETVLIDRMKLVGLGGMSGSGKSFMISNIREMLKENVSVLSLDNYYKPIEFQKKDENGFENFDLPEGLDIAKLMDDLGKLQRGESIRFKVYNFNNPGREEEFMEIQPAPILIIEGLFVFHFQAIFKQLDYSIFISASHQTTLKRRLERDIAERGLTEEIIRYQWDNHALPGFESYVELHKSTVNLIIDNDDNNTDALMKLLDVLKNLIPDT